MKTISILLFIVAVAITTTRAQDQKKSTLHPLPPKAAPTTTAQPLPPKSNNTVNERGIIIVSGLPKKKAQNQGNEKMLNPQPLPPKANIKH